MQCVVSKRKRLLLFLLFFSRKKISKSCFFCRGKMSNPLLYRRKRSFSRPYLLTAQPTLSGQNCIGLSWLELSCCHAAKSRSANAVYKRKGFVYIYFFDILIFAVSKRKRFLYGSGFNSAFYGICSKNRKALTILPTTKLPKT